MDKVLITGSLGQIGTELIAFLRTKYGNDNVIATDIQVKDLDIVKSGPFEKVDILDAKKLAEIVDRYKITKIINLAAILSATAEAKHVLAYNINMNGLFNILEIAREKNISVFTPSSIAAFGDSTPKDNTPQLTIQRPSTMYGLTKVAGELLCDYYFTRFGVDTRGVRFPGLISYTALPGGGTTDYAVDIYYEAIRNKKYTSFIKEGSYMDMMYMPDALNAMYELIEADPSKLNFRNAYNIGSMSIEPEDIKKAIQKHIPEFELTYDVDPVRQAIADSWPNSLDDSAAREDWGWKPKYNLEVMTEDMLIKLKEKLSK